MCPLPPMYCAKSNTACFIFEWEIVLNDYSKGALEALAWVQQLVKKLKRDPNGWARLEGEMEAAKNDMLNGIGVDFRDRLRLGV